MDVSESFDFYSFQLLREVPLHRIYAIEHMSYFVSSVVAQHNLPLQTGSRFVLLPYVIMLLPIEQ